MLVPHGKGVQIWRPVGGTNMCHGVLQFKRKVITLELRHVEISTSPSEKILQFAKTKEITHLLTFASPNAKAWKFKRALFINGAPC